MKIKFFLPAQWELDDAVAWYNEQSPKLGIEFLDDLETVKGSRPELSQIF